MMNGTGVLNPHLDWLTLLCPITSSLLSLESLDSFSPRLADEKQVLASLEQYILVNNSNFLSGISDSVTLMQFLHLYSLFRGIAKMSYQIPYSLEAEKLLFHLKASKAILLNTSLVCTTNNTIHAACLKGPALADHDEETNTGEILIFVLLLYFFSLRRLHALLPETLDWQSFFEMSKGGTTFHDRHSLPQFVQAITFQVSSSQADCFILLDGVAYSNLGSEK
ncbi:hypothetical protein HHK36_013117 [Tetracentron sinense]|uniref:Uncharacterized protein n=1 Tax=Tetracentron sinense TaxID=13715 RepID=A0A834ZA43_TETSI|nr:hypothetical protein HHK36_013117 [Tetracentron sinense]